MGGGLTPRDCALVDRSPLSRRPSLHGSLLQARTSVGVHDGGPQARTPPLPLAPLTPSERLERVIYFEYGQEPMAQSQTHRRVDWRYERTVRRPRIPVAEGSVRPLARKPKRHQRDDVQDVASLCGAPKGDAAAARRARGAARPRDGEALWHDSWCLKWQRGRPADSGHYDGVRKRSAARETKDALDCSHGATAGVIIRCTRGNTSFCHHCGEARRTIRGIIKFWQCERPC